MRYLAIDLGAKRTGLAIGDNETGITSPLGMVQTGDEQERIRGIAKVVDEESPHALVNGLPLNMDGNESPGSTQARHFASRLHQQFGLDVHLVDERLTTNAADERLSGTGFTRDQKKARRDGIAAAEILKDFLNAQRNEDYEEI